MTRLSGTISAPTMMLVRYRTSATSLARGILDARFTNNALGGRFLRLRHLGRRLTDQREPKRPPWPGPRARWRRPSCPPLENPSWKREATARPVGRATRNSRAPVDLGRSQCVVPGSARERTPHTGPSPRACGGRASLRRSRPQGGSWDATTLSYMRSASSYDSGPGPIYCRPACAGRGPQGKGVNATLGPLRNDTTTRFGTGWPSPTPPSLM